MGRGLTIFNMNTFLMGEVLQIPFFHNRKNFTLIFQNQEILLFKVKKKCFFFKSDGPTLGTPPGHSFSYDFFRERYFA